MTGVDEHALELVLEDRPDRLPEHAGRLHRDLRDTVRGQPVTQRQQAANRRRELRNVLLTLPSLARQTYARGHLLLVHVQRPRALDDRLHHGSPRSANTNRRPGASELTSLTVVLKATVRSSGETHTPN